MFEQAFKNINDILHKDAGSSSKLDYTGQHGCITAKKGDPYGWRGDKSHDGTGVSHGADGRHYHIESISDAATGTGGAFLLWSGHDEWLGSRLLRF